MQNFRAFVRKVEQDRKNLTGELEAALQDEGRRHLWENLLNHLELSTLASLVDCSPTDQELIRELKTTLKIVNGLRYRLQDMLKGK